MEDIWKNINDLLARTSANINILEEKIDVNVQRRFMELSARLRSGEEEEEFENMMQRARENVERLFDSEVSDEEKKELLVVLSAIDDVAIYRAIESFSKQRSRLKKWATVALQQSRMLIQSALMDETSLFVSTGLGGSGSNLRYFCVLIVNKGMELKPFQRNVIRGEAQLAIEKQGGSIEQCDIRDRYVTMMLLLPLLTDLRPLFDGLIEECNKYGNFLHEHIIITNVKRISTREIEQLIHNEMNREDEAD
ncbi:MAG: hypothetical protein LBG30_01270 [Odoribacteraceae bacterium]|jgi:hypothetical protein|nr:hypothetical protein [Odoribacteraceae bacterium]